MAGCFSIKTCAKSVLNLRRYFRKQVRSHVCNIMSLAPSSSYCHILKQGSSRNKYPHSLLPSIASCFFDHGFRGIQRIQYRAGVVSKKGSLTVKGSVSLKGLQETLIDFSTGYHNGSLSTLLPTRGLLSNFKCNFAPFSWSTGSVTAGVVSGLLLCYSTSDSVHAEASDKNGDNGDSGKKVYTDYTVIGIPGDGRCLFRSVAHGACLRSGKPAPNENLQKQLADELRAGVAEEFIRRQKETEW